MPEKLEVLTLNSLLPREDNNVTPLFLAFGEKPRQAEIAYIIYSREQLRGVLSGIKKRLAKGVLQQILTASETVAGLPEDIDIPAVTFEGSEAQSVFNKAHPPFLKPMRVSTDGAGRVIRE